MSDQQFMLVPKISSYPGAQTRAHAMLRWLVGRDIVQPNLSRCGLGTGGLAYAIAPGAVQILRNPADAEALPFGLERNGLEIITQRCAFTPMQGFTGRARCPECRRQVGEVLLEHLEIWMPGETDNFSCPECDHEDDINGFAFEQPCAFSDLGFIFNNWPGELFDPLFIEQFAERLGFKVQQVQARI
jgi:hypothetical protein